MQKSGNALSNICMSSNETSPCLFFSAMVAANEATAISSVVLNIKPSNFLTIAMPNRRTRMGTLMGNFIANRMIDFRHEKKIPLTLGDKMRSEIAAIPPATTNFPGIDGTRNCPKSPSLMLRRKSPHATATDRAPPLLTAFSSNASAVPSAKGTALADTPVKSLCTIELKITFEPRHLKFSAIAPPVTNFRHAELLLSAPPFATAPTFAAMSFSICISFSINLANNSKTCKKQDFFFENIIFFL
jgi:hypothetical protein